jgi:hypothetical protein
MFAHGIHRPWRFIYLAHSRFVFVKFIYRRTSQCPVRTSATGFTGVNMFHFSCTNHVPLVWNDLKMSRTRMRVFCNFKIGAKPRIRRKLAELLLAARSTRTWYSTYRVPVRTYPVQHVVLPSVAVPPDDDWTTFLKETTSCHIRRPSAPTVEV